MLLVSCLAVLADWPMLHGSAEHTGFLPGPPPENLRLHWVRHFENERLGTAMEAIVGNRKVFLATHQGSIYALDEKDGTAAWRFEGADSFLHSPAFDMESGTLLAADAAGRVVGLDSATGGVKWERLVDAAGFSASPTVASGTTFIGARSGNFFAVSMKEGRVLWERNLGAPLRQTAAVSGGKVFVTSEDLRVHCLDAKSGEEIWLSEPLRGQTAGEYYPQIITVGGKRFLIVRTNPILSMGNQIGRDRTMLLKNAGVDGSDWKKLDAYTKSTNALGSPELWRREQSAIIAYEKEHAESRTFFVLDAETGKEAFVPPVLWIAGCQGVGAQPALTPDGRLLVYYRSAYGNWNLGVAPLVALGVYDLTKNEVTPLPHTSGMTPPWNTFWGTADESQNFTVISNSVFIVHQGTLSLFDLATRKLSSVWGERDTYGGFRSPSWARNEWHGPGRGAIAVDQGRVFWMTGSRVLCLASEEPKSKPEDLAAKPAHEVHSILNIPPPSEKELEGRLAAAVSELLSANWAPLYVEPGLAGREFFFDDSGDEFEALSFAFKHLSGELQNQVKARLAEEWTQHSPFSLDCAFNLKSGARRELFWIPEEALGRLGQDKMPNPFGNTFAIWLYADKCGQWPRVLEAYPRIKASFEAWRKNGWRLDPQKGDLFANRYLASLLALNKIAQQADDAATAADARELADKTGDALLQWWKNAAESGTLRNFKGSGELDPFINKGDSFSFKIAPHRHKLALIHELTPDVAALVRARAAQPFESLSAILNQLYATWPYVGEERQVHSGENFVDPPDLAMDAFTALAWVSAADRKQLARRVDVPFCKADLYYITKLALALEAQP